MAERGRPKRERPELCSKCQIYPPIAGQSWCVRCDRASREAALERKLSQSEAAGFARGIDAMRETLALEFERWGTVTVRCSEVAGAIRKAPRPLHAVSAGANAGDQPMRQLVPSQ